MASLQGQLLIAAPALADPNFARTVVAIAKHDEDGALGLVLNRPSEQLVAEVVPALTEVVGASDQLYVGGPVQPEAVLLLAEFDDPVQDAIAVTTSIGLVSDATALDELSQIARRQRAFAGYAGWGPGQLDSEIERDDWFLEPATAEDLFCENAERLWSQVLERMGGQYQLVARMPDDVSVN